MENEENAISRLAQKAGYNTRQSIQTDLEFVFSQAECWKVRQIPGLSLRMFEKFIHFAEHIPPWGLGWTPKTLEAYLRPELEYIWQAIESDIPSANKHGGERRKGSSLIYKVDKHGTSRPYRIAVLKRDAPDIAERVIQKEISAAEGIRQLNAIKQKHEGKLFVKIEASISGYLNSIKNNLSQCDIDNLIQLLKKD